MLTALLVVTYIAYIGLGIPDSLFGTAWPAIYSSLSLPVSLAGYVTMAVSGCTVLSSLFAARLVGRFGTGRVAAASTIATAGALLGYSFSENAICFFLLAIPSGFGAGAIDAALNHFVALHYKASHMNFLHCFYGIGVSFSPYVMSLALSDNEDWRSGYRNVFWIQMGIAVLLLLVLPLWKRVNVRGQEGSETPQKILTIREMAKIQEIRLSWLAFFSSDAIIYVCGTWGSTFFVDSRGLPVDSAARMTMLYYAGLAIGRFLSGMFAVRFSCWLLVHIGKGVILAGIVCLLLPVPAVVAGTGFFFVGIGVGPAFPNLTHLTPQNFGKNISQSVMGSQTAACYVGSMLMPSVTGALMQKCGTSFFPFMLLGLFILFFLSLFALTRKLKKLGRYPVPA